nr:RluA family pseudouridine synthase [uncultured Solibaculum sp.]
MPDYACESSRTVLRFPVPPECDGMRLKTFLRGRCGVSYRLVVRLKHVPMGMTMAGQLIRTIDPVRAGQVVELRLPPDTKIAQPMGSGDLRVLFEDAHLLIVDKPAGMAVHPSAGREDNTLLGAAAVYRRQHGEDGAFRPVGRLDRDTSGIMVLAKHSHAAHLLNGHVEKWYLAICLGELKGQQTIDLPLRVKEGHSIQREVGEGGQRAVTHWQSLFVGGHKTLLGVRIETGRTHQIRAHMAHIGHPLAGDTMYGPHDRNGIGRHALHCGAVRLVHPVTGQHIGLTAPLPDDMRHLLEQMGASSPEKVWRDFCRNLCQKE